MEDFPSDVDETSFAILKYEISETETTGKVCHIGIKKKQ